MYQKPIATQLTSLVWMVTSEKWISEKLQQSEWFFRMPSVMFQVLCLLVFLIGSRTHLLWHQLCLKSFRCSSETSTDKTSNLSPSVVDLDFWVRLDHNEICLLEKHFWEDNHAVKQIPYCRVSTWKMGKSSFQLSISSNSSFSTSRIQATGILEFGTTIFILVVVIRSMVISRTKLFGLLTVTIQFWDALEASQWTLLADWGF